MSDHHHKCTEGRVVRTAALCGGERLDFGAGCFRVHILKAVSATKLYRSLLPHLKAAACKACFTYLQELTKISSLKVLSQSLLTVRC